jgi:hypothetical protein
LCAALRCPLLQSLLDNLAVEDVEALVENKNQMQQLWCRFATADAKRIYGLMGHFPLRQLRLYDYMHVDEKDGNGALAFLKATRGTLRHFRTIVLESGGQAKVVAGVLNPETEVAVQADLRPLRGSHTAFADVALPLAEAKLSVTSLSVIAQQGAQDLSCVALLPRLRKLNLREVMISAADTAPVPHLLALPALRKLSLGHCRVTGEELKQLAARVTTLEELEIEHCSDDAILEAAEELVQPVSPSPALNSFPGCWPRSLLCQARCVAC